MKKQIRRRFKLILVLCIALTIGGAFFIHNAVMAETQGFYIYYINSADNNAKVPITEYTIEENSLVVHLNSDSGLFDTDTIEWKVEDSTVLSVESSGNKTSATINCLKPGTSKVWAEISRPTGNGDEKQIFSAECIFTVRLAINDFVDTPLNIGKILHLFNEDPDNCGSLVIDVGETFGLGLKIGQAQAQDLSWTSLNKNIAEIDSSGKVTGIQPGIAKILAQTYKIDNQNNILQSDYIYVVVKPKFKNENGTVSNEVNLSNPEVLETNISDYVSTSEEILVRNASEFAWIVKNKETNEVLVNTYTNKTSPLVKITPSKVDGTVAIDCKSGNYTVEVYPLYPKDVSIDVMAADNYHASKANITEYVDIDALSELDYVQVNDVWDLYKISNIFDIAKDFDINITNCEYNKLKGTITFDKEGIAMVQFKRKTGSDLPLDSSFTSNVLNMYVIVRPYTAQDKTVRIKKGGTERISVSDYGYDASQYGVVYEYLFKSNNETIATVFSNTPKTADIFGVKEGTTTVDCIIYYDNGISRKLTTNIIVWKKISATLDITEKELMIDQQFTINATYPANANPASDINVKWVNVTNNPANSPIQIVNNEDSNYKSVGILGIREGRATIVLRDMNDGMDLAVCNINVVKSTTISFGKTDYDVTLDKTNTASNKMNLELIYSPKVPENPRVEWKSTNTSVATVENGIVTYKSAGYTYISATYYLTDNITSTASCRLNVYQKIDKISIEMVTSGKINAGDKILLRANYTPIDYIKAVDKVLTWTSNNEAVVKISGNNEFPTVNAVGPGKATITVTTTSGKTAAYVIDVIQQPISVSFPDKSITMEVGDKKQLTAVLAPLNVTDNTLTFTSGNEDFLTIDNKGIATAVYASYLGKITVPVSVRTANGLTATLSVTIVQRVKDLQLNITENKIAKGTTFKLTPTIVPANAYNRSVSYASSNTRVATVSSSGIVTGVNGGVALISCTANDTGLTRYCLVIVEEKVTSITLDKTSYIIGVGKIGIIKATVKSNFATNTKVKWTSSNSKIVYVNKNGAIKGLKTGYATITATALDGSGEKASCRVRVIRQATSIRLNKSSAQIVEGDSLKLTATIKPSNATLKSVTWTSSDEQVAYVDALGKVIAVKKGKCKITATTNDGTNKRASCIIQVIEEKPITALTIVNRNITMVVGENTKLNSFVAPKKNTDTVRWYSDDSRIVAINSKTGKMKALRTGTATITLASSGGKSTTTTVTVVGLNRSTLTLEQYDTYQLRVINGRSVQWDSVNQRVVNVSRTGKLSARRKGTTYVTALVNGRKIKCKVRVKNIK